MAVGLWGLGSAIASSLQIIDQVYIWWQIGYVGIIFTSILYFHFVLEFLKIRKNFLLRLGYFIAIAFLFFNIFQRDMFLGNFRFVFDQFYWHDWFATKQYLFLVFLIYFYCFPLYAFWLLYRSYRFSQNALRNQIKYFIVGSIIGWIGTIGDYIVVFHLDIYPYTNALMIIYPAIWAYAIMRHNLVNIDTIIRKTLIYSILISTITLVYFLIIFLLEHILRIMLGYDSLSSAIVLITLLALLFMPLKNMIQMLVDKYFFRGSIEKVYNENSRLKEELQRSEKLKAVATFAAGMAHEIKNPLTSIKTFTEYLPQKGTNPAFREKFHQIVGHEVEKINHIVKQLLEFSRPRDLDLKESNINTLLDETLDLLNNDLLKKNIKIHKQYTNLPLINIDPSQMKQVFLNLFLNAVDAMPTGGTITIQTSTTNAINATNITNNPRHTTYDIRNTNTVVITITDTGHGIAKEDLKHIFDPFFTKKEGGTGLGLSVVHGIIEKHKGRIHVSSQLNAGTTFSITLPTTQQAQ